MVEVVTAMGGELRLELREGYVHASHARSARDIGELEIVIGALERALARVGTGCLLFDSRQSDRTSSEVQDRLWRWLQEAGLKKVATLVSSDMLQVSLKMTGLARGVKLRAFDDEADAEAWLRATP